MMKGKCKNCGQRKAKRACIHELQRQLCPLCCAELRTDRCTGCAHHRVSERFVTEERREKKFATQLDPDIDKACDEALSLAEEGKLSSTEERMRELLRRHPNYHTVQYGMGVCRALQRKDKEAADYFRKAVEIFPYFTEAHFNLGMACSGKRDLRGSVHAFRKVINIGGDEEVVSAAKRRVEEMERVSRKISGVSLDVFLKNMDLFDRAFQLLEQGGYESSARLYQQVLSTDHGHVQSWGNLGLAYAGLGEKAKALECLGKALELDPEYEVALVNRRLVEALDEGERLECQFKRVDYYKDYRGKGEGSYIADFIKENEEA